MREFDVIVIGAGGAGLMCAIQAGQRRRTVCVIDHNYRIGRKILISGGGRCNFTNIHTTAENYVSKNPHFCKSALARYKPSDFIALVKEHRIRFHEKKLGQLFCDDSAQQIVDMLVDESNSAGVYFKLGTKVHSVTNRNGAFLVRTNDEELHCASLVVATGGPSIPQIGATGFGYDLARQFGLRLVKTQPALVGFNFSKADLARYADLSGVSIDAITSCNEASFRENMLFTHTGISGPGVLQASLYWEEGGSVQFNLLPDSDLASFLRQSKHSGRRAELKTVLAEVLPKRFTERWCETNFPSRTLAELADGTLEEIAAKLQNWIIKPATSVGYKKAEVTRGGVDTDELSSKTMECKKVSGLFFIGEVVDVTGQLGGFNFQWAWASAVAAGQVV